MNQRAAGSFRRTRTTTTERAAWVQRYERSGLTQGEFATRHRLGLSTLRRWLAQERAADPLPAPPPPLWQEVKLPTAAPPGRWAAELVRPDGLTLRVAHDVPAELLATLWRVPPC